MQKPIASYDLEGLSVLLIDSNRHMRMIVRSILQSLGCKSISECGDAADALRENQHIHFDLIIVSWLLEPVTGPEFVKMVRTSADSNNRYAPVIMMSGQCEYSHVTEARDIGVNEFLAKPLSPHTLYQRIASLIDDPRPFISHKSYVGPCRRRQELGPIPSLGERRKKDAFAE